MGDGDMLEFKVSGCDDDNNPIYEAESKVGGLDGPFIHRVRMAADLQNGLIVYVIDSGREVSDTVTENRGYGLKENAFAVCEISEKLTRIAAGPKDGPVKPTSGADRIGDERQRQIDVEKWTPEHDDEEHCVGDLALAAVCYATPFPLFKVNRTDIAVCWEDPFPWDWADDRRERTEPSSSNQNTLIPNENLPKEKYIKNLVMAGALIAAEIDKLLRGIEREEKGADS